MLKRFSVYDLIVVAVMAAIGVAIKPIVSSAVHIVSAPLMIPGGSLAGGLYMMWIVLAFALTGRIGAATLTGLVQALMVMLIGAPGSHGVMSLISYTMPGVSVDIIMFLIAIAGKREFDRIAAFFTGMAANMTGTFFVNIIFFHLPTLFLALTLCAAALSGGAGGLIAYLLYDTAKKHRLIKKRNF